MTPDALDILASFGITLAPKKRKATARKSAAKKPAKVEEELILSNTILDRYVDRSEIAFVFPCKSDPNGEPLTGSSFGMLSKMLAATGVSLNRISQYYILGDYIPFTTLTKAFQSPEAANGVTRVSAELVLRKFKMVVIFSKQAMKKMIHGTSDLDDERGAPSLQPWGVTICTYHPKDCFIDFSLSLVSELDLAKAVRLSKSEWVEKEVNIAHTPTFIECCTFLDRLAEQADDNLLACDIETTYTTIVLTCVGFSADGKSAFVIPWSRSGHPHWSVTEEMILLRKLSKVIAKRRLLGQNAVHFDHYVFATRYNLDANFVEDTMLLHWEMHPELPKSLGFINSFYTDNPYWKSMLKKVLKGTLPPYAERVYNGKDNTNTMESYEMMLVNVTSEDFHRDAMKHYRFNIEVSKVLQYMSIHGAYLNTTLLNDKLAELEEKGYCLHRDLTALAGKELNVSSPAQMKTYLYDELKLPERYKTVMSKEGDYEDKVTQDYLTTLLLSHEFPKITQLGLIASLRKLKKRKSSLSTSKVRKDGKVGWGFNIVGTTSGRLSSYKPVDEEGVQAQNVDRFDRDLYSFNPVAVTDKYRVLNEQGKVTYAYSDKLEDYPDDFWMWMKADLEGADSWTVAAQLCALGDSTMIEDLRAGIKPAQVLALASMIGNHVMEMSREDILKLKHLLKTPEGKQEYFIAKPVNHGSAYMMAERTMHLNIFKFSKGDVWVSPEDCKIKQGLLFKRYNYPKLHKAMETYMNSRSYLDMPYGHRHYFYGRKDNSTLRAMLSTMPQYNTTITANVVLHRLYYGEDNRKGSLGDLYLRMANQVHDETDCAVLVKDLPKAREVWEANHRVKLEVMGVPFEIPFEASFGPTWGTQLFNL